MRSERAACRRSSGSTSYTSEPGGCYDEIIKYIVHCINRARRKIGKLLKQTFLEKMERCYKIQKNSLGRERDGLIYQTLQGRGEGGVI